MIMDRSVAWCAVFVSIAGIFAGLSPGVKGHVYLMQPIGRNFYYSPAFQNWDFEGITYCPHCYQSRGAAAVRARAEANTPADTLSSYGEGAWPHKTAYDRGELASNGNFLENEEIAVRHGICGDPEQTAAEGTNTFGRENSVYPVLETYQEGSVIEMKVVVSTYHWGHLEYFICNSEDLSDSEGSAVTQGCFNMHPLTRVEDDGDASPIDPNHLGRYYMDPPCRENETDQTKADGAFAGYVVTGRYQLPEGLTCQRCIVQMVYYTGNACTPPGYEDFNPDSVPGGCAPSIGDWVTLDPPPCGDGLSYPEEFWNCADISITSDQSLSTPAPASQPASTLEPATPAPTAASTEPTPAPAAQPGVSPEPSTPAPMGSFTPVPAAQPEATPQPATSFPAEPSTPEPAVQPEETSEPSTPAPMGSFTPVPAAQPVATPQPATSFPTEPSTPEPAAQPEATPEPSSVSSMGPYTPAPAARPNATSEPATPVPMPPPTPAPVTQPEATAEPVTPAPTGQSTETPAPASESSAAVDDDDGNCSEPVGAWEQCGGEGWTGSTCCPSGYECSKLADSYSQCRPSLQENGCSSRWGQCGGIGWVGPTCCSDESECKEWNEWYSQCVP